jgi:hypothetical protein
VPGVFTAPTITHLQLNSIGASAQTRNVVMGFIDALLSSRTLTAHSDDHGAQTAAYINQKTQNNTIIIIAEFLG